MANKRLYYSVAGVLLVSLMGIRACAVSQGDKMATNTKKTSTAEVTHKHTNKLITESSPYLLQHAHNPVDWFPWGPEAFERAEKEGKPIFLSIGYSTCHWCHVMERESFENEHIAGIMNEHFISIKVDREQRPDVDEIYMKAVQMMTGSGGWPLSVFLMPDGKAFYGGTYFPPNDMLGRPGFERVLLSIADMWKNNRKALTDSAGKLNELLQSTIAPVGKGDLSPELLDRAFGYFRSTFDPVNGGFGSAPKFPQPVNLSMLLGYWYRTGETQALQMVERTLDAMAEGGIYDHIGGGFHRYSTDARWLVPHFEKMLYDQALLSRAYLQAYQITGKKKYARVAREIFDYVLRDMTDAGGGFYSAEDADSEGKEGTFYLWDTKEISSILSRDEAAVFSAYYGITKAGNFEEDKTILNVKLSIEELQKKLKKDSAEIETLLTKARSKIFAERTKRIRPHLDDKVIAAWNGLMISSLAYGGSVLQEEKYTKAAEKAATFILNRLHENNRLMRYYRDGRVVEKGFIDDYAFMTLGLMDLYEAVFDARWLIEAAKLAEEMMDLFADNEQGGFFLTGKDAEKLIARSKPGYDGAVPSGNSLAAMALLKLGKSTMDQRFTEQGSGILNAFSQQLESSPINSPAMLTALSFLLGPTQEIVIAGQIGATDTRQMVELVHSKFLPNAIVLLHEQGKAGADIEKAVPFTRNFIAIDGKATAYICQNYACNKPVNKIDDLKKLLANISQKSRSNSQNKNLME